MPKRYTELLEQLKESKKASQNRQKTKAKAIHTDKKHSLDSYGGIGGDSEKRLKKYSGEAKRVELPLENLNAIEVWIVIYRDDKPRGTHWTLLYKGIEAVVKEPLPQKKPVSSKTLAVTECLEEQHKQADQIDLW